MESTDNVRVFVVDDEQVIAETLALILRQNGFVAEYFVNPLEALAKAAEEVPDLLISDVVMPQMSGIELAIRLRSLHPTCKILLFSGQAATADLLRNAQEDGHTFDLLLKPVYPADLLAAIRRVAPESESQRMTTANQ